MTNSQPGQTVVATIAEVIAKMKEIEEDLPRKDGVAYFNRLYLAVTNAVQAAYADASFENPAFLEKLDVVFAGGYFAAEATIASRTAPPPAWAPLIDERSAKHEPILFALCGLNAHIGHDLPLAVVQTCQELGLAPDDDTPQRADYKKVNAILGRVEPKVARWFKTGVVADLEDVTPQKVDNELAMWSIVAARELAWRNAQVIWKLRMHPLRAAYEDALARSTEVAGRAWLV
jgi:hypothetical protein